VACQHRIDVLGPNWQHRYRCCQNVYEQCHPACVCCTPCAINCPEFSLLFESVCCYGLAVAGSRYQFNIDNNITDRIFERYTGNTLCLLECCGYLPLIGPALNRSVSACLVVQQDHELRRRGLTSNLGLASSYPHRETQPLLSKP
jgi:hypothetical protein